MSSALYRRYRPESFAEVIGQEHVTSPLSVALDKDRINHAYLFSGPRGCGKTTSARIMARCLNCAQGPTSTPCGTCDSCRDLARGGAGSLDVVEIDAASHGGVDDARDLRERAAFAPVRDRYKVFIIDEAHMVSTQGFNALLKIVEEPPPHIRFIFATTEPEKVIGTIRSRTHHYPFRLVPPERLQAYLSELCTREQVPVDATVLPLVVRAGGGSVRDSLSVLDQLMAGAGAEGLTYPLAVSLLGYTDGALLDDVVDALAAGDGASVFAVVDRVVESGHDPRRFVEDLLERLRDLLVVAATREGAHLVLRSVPEDQLQRMQGQAQRFGAGELSRAADVVNAALTEMTGATSPRLQVELLCARLLLPAADDAERGIRARLDKLERRIGMAVAGQAPAAHPASPAPAAAPVAPTRPAPVAAPPPAASAPAPAAAAAAAPAAGPASAPAAPVAQPEAASAPAGDAWPEVSNPGSPAAPAPAPAAAAAPAAPAPVAPPAAAPQPAPAAATAPGALDVDTVRRMWPEVLATLAGMKRVTWSLVSHYAQVLEYDGDRLVLGFDSAGRAASFGKGAHQEFLRQALIEVLGLDCRFEAVAGDAPRVPPAQRPQAAVADDDPPPGAAPAEQPSVAPAAVAPQAAPAPGPEQTPAAPPEAARLEPQAAGRPDPAPAARPEQARPEQARPEQGRPEQRGPEQRGSGSGRPQQGRPASTRGDAPPDDSPPDRMPPQATPYDDIPPPDEPPPDFEPPPEEGGWSRRPPANRPGAQPPQAQAAQPPAPQPPAAQPPTAQAARPPAGDPPSARASSASAGAAAVRQAVAARPASRPAAPAPSAAVAGVVSVSDDEISIDDPEIEGSGLVGAAVVEQMLGGRIIEERSE